MCFIFHEQTIRNRSWTENFPARGLPQRRDGERKFFRLVKTTEKSFQDFSRSIPKERVRQWQLQPPAFFETPLKVYILSRLLYGTVHARDFMNCLLITSERQRLNANNSFQASVFWEQKGKMAVKRGKRLPFIFSDFGKRE